MTPASRFCWPASTSWHSVGAVSPLPEITIDVQLESWTGSPVIRRAGADYRRIAAASYRDTPARLTARQGVFYRNLIRIAEALGHGSIPVDFILPSGERLYLDRGCIRIAELAGFVAALRNDDDGTVSFIELSWMV